MEDKDVILSIIIGVIIMGVFMGVLFGLDNWGNIITCNQRFVSFEHKYGFWSGCLIKVNNKWVPDESFYIKEDVR